MSTRERGTLRALRRQVGYLPQIFGYLPHFTVREYVEYVAWLREVARPEMAQRVTDALEAVGLSDAGSLKMRKLSGGMLRRAGIAQAIVGQPQVLILDEPTAGLDPEQRVAGSCQVK